MIARSERYENVSTNTLRHGADRRHRRTTRARGAAKNTLARTHARTHARDHATTRKPQRRRTFFQNFVIVILALAALVPIVLEHLSPSSRPLRRRARKSHSAISSLARWHAHVQGDQGENHRLRKSNLESDLLALVLPLMLLCSSGCKNAESCS